MDDKSIIQSRLLTQARYNFNIHEKRIIYKLMEAAQSELEGRQLSGKITIEKTLFGDRVITLGLSELVPDGLEATRSEIKKAFRKLLEKVIEINHPDGGWEMHHYIHSAKHNPKSMKYEIKITGDIWQAYLDYTRGYSVYFLDTAMSFGSTYAMRLYELLANNVKPITYTIDYLRDIFVVKNKYKETKDFIKRVIEKPLEEITEKSEIKVSYEYVKTGNKITALTFYVFKKEQHPIEEFKAVKYRQNKGALGLINPNVIDCLKGWFEFTDREILANAELIYKAQYKYSFEALIDQLSKCKGYTPKARNKKAYVINSIKRYLQD